jgi:hypothetical protein
MTTDKKESVDSHENGPLHRPKRNIDAGEGDTSNEGPIVDVSRDMHTTKPIPGHEADGQVSKM